LPHVTMRPAPPIIDPLTMPGMGLGGLVEHGRASAAAGRCDQPARALVDGEAG
jgi:hypothetical protein